MFLAATGFCRHAQIEERGQNAVIYCMSSHEDISYRYTRLVVEYVSVVDLKIPQLQSSSECVQPPLFRLATAEKRIAQYRSLRLNVLKRL